MPPVSQPGSRAGLITALVVFVVLFFFATVFFIYFMVERDKTAKELNDTRGKYARIATEGQLASDELSRVLDLRNSPEYSNKTALDILLAQRDDLARAIVGSTATHDQAIKALKAAGEDARKKVEGVVVPTNSAINTIKTLSDEAAARLARIKEMEGQLAAATSQRQATVAQGQAQLAELQSQIEALNRKIVQEQEAVRKAIQEKDKALADLDEQRKMDVSQGAEAANKLNQELAVVKAELAKMRRERDAARSKLMGLRPDTVGPTVRQVDGKIVKIAEKAIVYINLGSGQQITPGMTFTVYDRLIGVPQLTPEEQEQDLRLNDGARLLNLPEGKGSIEVVRVDEQSSECRIIRTSPGQQIVEGDVIANVVYDRHIKYAFCVYGRFDLDQNGVSSAADAEVIKRLIQSWGGRIVDEVNVDTDFLVMGVEPEVPNFNAEELLDPINRNKWEQAKAERDTYDKMRDRAQEYFVPVLSQNRFLHYTGYYDMARR